MGFNDVILGDVLSPTLATITNNIDILLNENECDIGVSEDTPHPPRHVPPRPQNVFNETSDDISNNKLFFFYFARFLSLYVVWLISLFCFAFVVFFLLCTFLSLLCKTMIFDVLYVVIAV